MGQSTSSDSSSLPQNPNNMMEITSISEFNKLKEAPLLIIDFFATWCGPCKAISPIFERLSTEHASSAVVFAKCDVDKAPDVAKACAISAMPTFQFYKGGEKVDYIQGASVQKLQTKVGFYTAAIAKEYDAKNKAAAANAAAANPSSLRSLIDFASSRLCGVSNLSSVKGIISPSPTDPAIASLLGQAQLLIHLQFTTAITPHELRITVAKDSLAKAPSHILIGSNVPVKTDIAGGDEKTCDLEVESLNKAEEVQTLNIFSDEYQQGVAALKLKSSKFSGIRSLTIRVDTNLTGDSTTVTEIGDIDIIGIPA